MKSKEPLYRKVNAVARGVHHRSGPAYAWTRNTKAARTAEADEVKRGSMHQGKQRGLDYTPLFRFLLSRVGREWAPVHAEALSRLDRAEPIGWMVALCLADQRPMFRSGDNSYFSGLYVTDDGILAIVDPDLTEDVLEPHCPCCTHSFNGKPFTRPHREGSGTLPALSSAGGRQDDFASAPIEDFPVKTINETLTNFSISNEIK